MAGWAGDAKFSENTGNADVQILGAAFEKLCAGRWTLEQKPTHVFDYIHFLFCFMSDYLNIVTF